MTSKISYIKFIREDIRHRSWLAVFSALVLFLAMPVYSAIYIDGMKGAQTVPGNTSAFITQNIRAIFPGLINGQNAMIVCYIIFLLAVLCAATGYGHIHSREKLDFYHSLPLRRMQWFSISYLSGILIFLIPYLINSFLIIAIGNMNGILNSALAVSSLIAVLGGCLVFLLIYTTCVLAMTLTGRTVTALLAGVFLIVSPLFILTTIESLEQEFFAAYYAPPGKAFFVNLSELLSPLGLSSKLLTCTGTYFPASAGSELTGITLPELLIPLAAGIIMTVLFLILSAVLYRKYPSEAAGNALAFPRSAPVLKVLACIPGAFIITDMIHAFTGMSLEKWFFPLSILTVLILTLFVEYIYRMDLRAIWRGWKSTLISIAGVAAIVSVLQFDLIGYDSYMPDEDNVARISILPDSFSNYFIYPSEYGPDSEIYLGFYVPEEDTALACSLAETGLRNAENGIEVPNTWEYSESESSDEKYMKTLFRFQLDSGRVIYRQYPLNREQLVPDVRSLLENKEFRKTIYPVFQLNRDDVYSINFSDSYQVPVELNLTDEQRSQLLDAYEQDLLAADASTLTEGTAIGSLEINIYDPFQPGTEALQNGMTADSVLGSPNLVGLSGFDLYPEYTNTLEFLENLGYTLRTEIDPEDVENLSITLSLDSVQSAKYSELFRTLPDGSASFTQYSTGEDVRTSDPEAIRLILDAIPPSRTELLDFSEDGGDSMEIEYKDGAGIGYYF